MSQTFSIGEKREILTRLKGVREYFDSPDKWIKENCFKYADGICSDVASFELKGYPIACCFHGAYRILYDMSLTLWCPLSRYIEGKTKRTFISEWNDTRGYAGVIEDMDNWIKELTAELESYDFKCYE